jgi:hypothetical protein
MATKWLSILALSALVSPLPGQADKSQAKPRVTVSGVFTGRSGKPMANAKVILADVAGDEEVTWAKVKLVASVPTATADGQGRFQLKGVTPGEYTLLYLPGGTDVLFPNEISVKALTAVTRSIAPLLRSVELGKTEPYPPKLWGKVFTLLKGHTFYSEGTYMRIWNASVRRGERGPYLEMRRGNLWLARMDGAAPVKLEAWSY